MKEFEEYLGYPRETVREVIDALNGDVLDYFTYTELYRYVVFGKNGSAFMEVRNVALCSEVTSTMADAMVAELDEASGRPSPLTVDRSGPNIRYFYTMNIDDFLDRSFRDMAMDLKPTITAINTLVMSHGFQDKYLLANKK